MGDDSTEDTREITGGEGNSELSSFTVVLLSLCEDVVIELLHEPLESDKFDNCVGHLS
jgi:hypothetical protein